MTKAAGYAGIGLAVLGILLPVSTEFIAGASDALLLMAPACWLGGLICGGLAWRTWPGKLAALLNGGGLLLIVLWVLLIAPHIRWG